MATSFEAYQKLIPGVTGSGLSAAANRYTFVKFGATEGTVVPITADTDDPCGILQQEVADGLPAQVCYDGFSKLQVGAAAPAYGAAVGTTSTGQAVARVVGDTTKHVKGKVIVTAQTQGNTCTVGLGGSFTTRPLA